MKHSNKHIHKSLRTINKYNKTSKKEIEWAWRENRHNYVKQTVAFDKNLKNLNKSKKLLKEQTEELKKKEEAIPLMTEDLAKKAQDEVKSIKKEIAKQKEEIKIGETSLNKDAVEIYSKYRDENTDTNNPRNIMEHVDDSKTKCKVGATLGIVGGWLPITIIAETVFKGKHGNKLSSAEIKHLKTHGSISKGGSYYHYGLKGLSYSYTGGKYYSTEGKQINTDTCEFVYSVNGKQLNETEFTLYNQVVNRTAEIVTGLEVLFSVWLIVHLIRKTCRLSRALDAFDRIAGRAKKLLGKNNETDAAGSQQPA